ncbi:MAG: hypothetical protein AAF531_10455 [Actinomycetota bacterium]
MRNRFRNTRPEGYDVIPRDNGHGSTSHIVDTLDEARYEAELLSQRIPEWGDIGIYAMPGHHEIEIWHNERCIRSVVEPAFGTLDSVTTDQLAAELLARGFHPATPLGGLEDHALNAARAERRR